MSDATTRSPCSTGPARDASDMFPSAPLPDSGPLPVCVPRCEADAGVAYFYDSLPSGSCSSESERCQMTVHAPCPCVTSGGPQDVMWCECSGGTWHCMIAFRAGAVCRCSDDDAGLDGATDADAF